MGLGCSHLGHATVWPGAPRPGPNYAMGCTLFLLSWLIVCPSCIDLSLDLLLCMIMGLLGNCCCGHPALSPRGYQLPARARGTSSPAVSASRVFFKVLIAGKPKLAGGSGGPGVHAAKAKFVVFLPDLTLGSPVEVRKIADSFCTKPDLNQSFPWAQKSYLTFFSPLCWFYSMQGSSTPVYLQSTLVRKKEKTPDSWPCIPGGEVKQLDLAFRIDR